MGGARPRDRRSGVREVRELANEEVMLWTPEVTGSEGSKQGWLPQSKSSGQVTGDLDVNREEKARNCLAHF